MDRETIVEGECQYFETLDEERRATERRIFGTGYGSTIVRRGYLLPKDLTTIASWKRPDARGVGSGNSEAIARRFSAAAIAHHSDPRLAIWILTHLWRVDVSAASALLTVLFPTEYATISTPAWAALESLEWQPDLEQVFGDQPVPEDFLDRCAVYEIYLDACRQRAAEYGVSLQTLARFLDTRAKVGDE